MQRSADSIICCGLSQLLPHSVGQQFFYDESDDSLLVVDLCSSISPRIALVGNTSTDYH